MPSDARRASSPPCYVRRVADVVAPGNASPARPGRRYPHQTLRAARRGRRHPPQSQPRSADQKFLYGYIWVTIAWLAYHPRWGRHRPVPCVPCSTSAPGTSKPADDPLRGQLPHQTGDGRGVGHLGRRLAALPGKILSLRQADWPYAADRFSRRGRPCVVVVSRLPQGRCPVSVLVPLAAGRAGGAAGRELTASRELAWPSGQASTAAGQGRRNSSCTGRQ